MWEELIFYVCSCQLSSLSSILLFFFLNVNKSDLFLPYWHHLASSFLAGGVVLHGHQYLQLPIHTQVLQYKKYLGDHEVDSVRTDLSGN